MTEPLFYADAYEREFDALVVGIDEPQAAVILDRSAFYPGGGGQPHDTGTLLLPEGALDVVKVKKSDDDIFHLVTAGADLPAEGTPVKGTLDWERRYALMRTHTAMHILCGVVWRDYGAQVTGGNMEPLQGRMDFEFERMERELVDEIEAKINAEVEAAREVVVRTLPRAEAEQIPDLIRTKINLVPATVTEIRTVEIVGLDLQADGGTHVANTREVGRLRVVDYKSKGRINKRIRLALE
jgi:misacylated tRNA(Ala) deacylase